MWSGSVRRYIPVTAFLRARRVDPVFVPDDDLPPAGEFGQGPS